MSSAAAKPKKQLEKAVAPNSGEPVAKKASATSGAKRSSCVRELPQVSKPKYDMVINNMVFTVRLNQKLNLKWVARALGGHHLEKTFPATVLRVNPPSATVNFFGSGTLVISGAGSPEEACCVAWLLCTQLSKLLKREFRVHDMQIENVVATVAVGYKIDRDLLAFDYSRCASFAPALISRVALKPYGKKPVILVYKSGKIVITGARHPDVLREAFRRIDLKPYDAAAPYRKLPDEFRKTLA